MDYKAISAVWELTMGCNMRCKHCGSCCENPANDELTTEEALKLCEDLGKLGITFVTLSGGEPTTRPDWNIIAKGLSDNGIIPTMITNGWLLDEEIVDKAIEAGINTIAISIDGLNETHDFMRRPGSFDRDMKALEILKNKNIASAVITTINNKNLSELEDMKKIFLEKKVNTWQFQIGVPMGNLHTNSQLVIEPENLDKVIDFAHENRNNGTIRIDFADCIGYYSLKEIEVRKASDKNASLWDGCNAGKRVMGILCNGDIVGCTSIRNKEFIEGNIRERSIIDIWNDPKSFEWSRSMKKNKLKGFCSKCAYGDICLGGCSNSRLCMEGTVYSENKYCSYSLFMNKRKQDIETVDDPQILYNTALNLIKKEQFQIADILIERALKFSDDENILATHGYVNYMLGNYDAAKEINEKLLNLDNNNYYANKGLGLTLCKLGQIDAGMQYLEKAITLCGDDMDPYYDFIVTLIENNNMAKAKEILALAKGKSIDFYNNNIDLYNSVS